MALLFDQMLSRLIDEADDEGLAQESDDEEYVYVSRLAEQIASHAMLQDDEDVIDFPAPPPSRLPSDASQKQLKFKNCVVAASSWGVGRPVTQTENFHTTCWPALQHEAYDFAAPAAAVNWSAHSLSEEELVCRRNLPVLHQNMSSGRHLQGVPLHTDHLYPEKARGWDSSVCQHSTAPMSHQISTSHRPPTCLTPGSTGLQRKDSIGTGVFLPKVLTSSSQSRRKFGLYGKSAYTPRSKG